jgi:nucleobase:cation symporter-1, NCS1 family
VLRRGAVSLAQLYRNDPAADYRFWNGFNPFAFVAIACGACVYVLLMNPLTFDTAPLFVFTSASLPALVTAMAVHVLLTRLIVIPAGKGAYGAS